MLFGFGRVPGCLGLLAVCPFWFWGVRASEVCWFGFEGGLLGAAWVLEGSGVYV